MNIIRLTWAEIIRSRLKNTFMDDDKGDKAFNDIPEVQAFITPILEYAREEEERITKKYKGVNRENRCDKPRGRS